MFKAIEKFMSFAAKVLLVALIFAWLEEVLNRLIMRWRTTGCDRRSLMADEMELFYMKHGIQCRRCKCWIPAQIGTCPVCNIRDMQIKSDNV